MTKKTPIKFKKFPKKKLPTRLSAWIVEAVQDAKMISKTPGYKLNMDSYNNIHYYDNKCDVCLGGAAILGCGMVNPGRGWDGNLLAEKVSVSLDHVRTYSLVDALSILIGVTPMDETLSKVIELDTLISANYNTSIGRAPWAIYLKVAKELDKMGL